VKVYSDAAGQRFGQFIGDVMLGCWVVVCVSLGLVVYRVTNALGAPGRKAAEAGDSLAGGLRDLADPAGDVPAVGDKLRAPIDGAAGAADKLAQAGRDQAHAVEQLAIVLALVTAGLPILFAALIWLPRRIRFSRRATAATPPPTCGCSHSGRWPTSRCTGWRRSATTRSARGRTATRP
jgi:hypothetical protein